MKLPRPQAESRIQRALAAAPVLVMFAWGIATAVGAGDYGHGHNMNGWSPGAADFTPVASLGVARMQETPSLPRFVGELDWDNDVSDLVGAGLGARLPLPNSAVEIVIAPPRPPAAPLHVTAGEIRRGESLAYLLRQQGVGSDKVALVTREMLPLLDFRYAQPGDRYRLAQDADGNVVDFRYAHDDESTLHLFRADEGYTLQREATEFVRHVVTIGGSIENSLYAAIAKLGEDPVLANDFAALFAWDIDFTRNLRPGDDFKILYERLYRIDVDGGERYLRPGRILAARYRGEVGEFIALYFEETDGRGGYFRPDGQSMEREFLVSPLEYGRITSSWSQARHHPILNVTRPHHGIDYAAPLGTPVWSVADGTVIYRGWGGDFGKLIKVRHVNGYVSYYAHLTRFASELELGARVDQKQVIGYVGSTGLSTGPHVCFRIAMNGKYVNPLTLKSPAGKPIPESEWMDFQVVRASLLSDLDVRRLASAGEAL